MLAAASVIKMITTSSQSGFITSTELKEFMLHFDDSISEPTKVMVLVAFSNWVGVSQCLALYFIFFIRLVSRQCGRVVKLMMIEGHAAVFVLHINVSCLHYLLLLLLLV